MVHALDRDASGHIEWTEFIAAALCVSVCRDQRRVGSAFAMFDGDLDGKISTQDISEVFTVGASERVRRDWKEHLDTECQNLAPERPKGPFTREQFERYMGSFMKVTS